MCMRSANSPLCVIFANFQVELSQITLKTLCFCAADEIPKKKQAKNAFFGTVWKMSTKKLPFSARVRPSNLVYIGLVDNRKKISSLPNCGDCVSFLYGTR